jgi:uncharacterized surface protein with fasciclin (FAS1) repeats
MRFSAAFQSAWILAVVGYSESTDASPRTLRRVQDNSQTRESQQLPESSYKDEISNVVYAELWNRWLLQDMSVKTRSPVAVGTKIPTKPPTKKPVSPPLIPPIMTPTSLPVAPLPPQPFPPLSQAPVPAPSRSPSLSPNESPSVSPSSAPVTLAPQSVAPATKLPSTAAPVAPTPAQGTLLQLVQTTPDLSTLASAIATDEANRNIPPFLAQILNNTRTSITLFAPVNSAFDALAQIAPGYLAQLITPSFGLQLFDLLAYHATSGIVPTSAFPRSNLPMLAAGRVNVTSSMNNTFFVRSFSPAPAQILPPFDIPATNGLAHVINNVLLPQFVFQNVMEGLVSANARNGGQFSTLLRLIAAAGLETTLEEASGVTLLAPINAAIPIETERFLLQPGNEDVLTAVLTYHVITELFNYSVQSVPTVLLVDTLQGETIVVGIVFLPDGGVLTRYSQANQLGFFVVRENIVYRIDTILVPPSLRNVVPRGPSNNTTTASATVSSSVHNEDMIPSGKRMKWVTVP